MEVLFERLGMQNIHPAVVHFPIALLIIYCLFELIPQKRLREKLFLTKSILLFIGTLSLFIVRETGETAKKSYTGEVVKIIDMHETFALYALYIFGILSLLYLLMIARKLKWKVLKQWYDTFWYDFLTHPMLRMILAFIGLGVITLTVTLGGTIVWGPLNDPFTTTVYKLFFGK